MKFYLDEDISPKLAEILRRRGVDAVSAHEIHMLGAADEDQLMAASAEGRAMVTRNRDDFITLTVRFFEDLKPHYGLIIIAHTIPGSDLKRLATLLKKFAHMHPEGLEPCTIEFLSRE